MGYKRHLEDSECQELHFKQARQQDFSNRSTQFAENLSCVSAPKKPDSAVDCYSENEKPLWHEAFENAVVPSNPTNEDVSFRVAASSSFSPEHNGLQDYTPYNNVCLPFYDRFPRKQVHIGSNHQASIPLLCADYCEEDKLMGTCIIPMPDKESLAADSHQLGLTGPTCGCLDASSLRCVRQHITEARYKLRKSLGHDKFASLGFNNMGEEVAWRWSEDEERHFHAVIYSNPMSLGRNFWKHLSQAFPTRSMKEIVSYYFNVFMLRKRASQNRSDVLDVDSDDDELHGIDVGPYEGEDSEEEDNDSAIESPVEEYGQFNHGKDIVNEDDDEDDDDDDDDGDNGDVANGYCDLKREDSGVDYMSAPPGEKSFNGCTHDSKLNYADGTIENYDEDLTIQDESCTSFEFQAYKGEVDSCSGYMVDMIPMLDFHDDEVLYRLYSGPEKVQDYTCLPLELEAKKESSSSCKPVAARVTDAMDLVPLMDFHDEKAWDAIFPGSL
ncbi:AT-rich interactive domain-containing protein 2 [Linum grandiflorum]